MDLNLRVGAGAVRHRGHPGRPTGHRATGWRRRSACPLLGAKAPVSQLAGVRGASGWRRGNCSKKNWDALNRMRRWSRPFRMRQLFGDPSSERTRPRRTRWIVRRTPALNAFAVTFAARRNLLMNTAGNSRSCCRRRISQGRCRFGERGAPWWRAWVFSWLRVGYLKRNDLGR